MTPRNPASTGGLDPAPLEPVALLDAPSTQAPPIHRRTLGQFLDLQPLSLGEFARKFRHPVLLSVPTVPEAETTEEAITDVYAPFDAKRIQPFDLGALSLADRSALEVLVLRKKSTSASDALWIGRTGACDVRIKSKAISRLHALVTQNNGGGFSIGDAGSSNGTFVDGLRVVNGSMTPLRDGASVVLGTLSLRFLLPASLHRELRRL